LRDAPPYSLVLPFATQKRVVRWIRNKLKKTDGFLEETIEEQENAVEKAIADMKARANEIQAKNAALASEQSMLDKTDPTAPKAAALTQTAMGAIADKIQEITTKGAAPATQQDVSEAKPVAKPEIAKKTQETLSKDAAPTTEKDELLEEEQKATTEAQIEIVEKVEVVQTKDAAVASEEQMLAQLDETEAADAAANMEKLIAQEQVATAGAQTEVVEKMEAVQTKDAAVASEEQTLATLDEMEAAAVTAVDMDDLIAKEQVATAEAQTEVVEKMEAVQAKDAALATEEGMMAQLDRPEATKADIMTEMKQPVQKQKVAVPAPSKATKDKPVGDRWAIAAPSVDLTGNWKLIVTDDFKKEYDDYLKQLGQPFIVRSVALTLIGVTTEQTEQKEEGRTLFIRGTNARGIWDRTLVTSGADKVNDQFTPLHVPVDTADDERVEAEAWWEDDGTVHRSWMRGLSKYGGGDFESKRYLDEGGKVLVCESVFHPKEKDRKDVGITWRFLRTGETLKS